MCIRDRPRSRSAGPGHPLANLSARSTPQEALQGGAARDEGTLADVTNPGNPIVLGDDLPFQTTITDLGEPGAADTLSFTLWEGNTGRRQRLLFSSAWEATRPSDSRSQAGSYRCTGQGSAAK